MKLKIILLSSLLCISAISCTKDSHSTRICSSVDAILVSYYIDGKPFCQTILNENEWYDLLDSFLMLAREGHRVTFSRTNSQTRVSPTKETTTFSTTSYQEAKNWCNAMVNDGWDVTIEFDKESGTYHCTASR